MLIAYISRRQPVQESNTNHRKKDAKVIGIPQTKSNRTKWNKTKPNQTKSNRTQPNPSYKIIHAKSQWTKLKISPVDFVKMTLKQQNRTRKISSTRIGGSKVGCTIKSVPKIKHTIHAVTQNKKIKKKCKIDY